MDSSDISTITKKMESMSMTHHVIRHNKRLPQSRYSPYTLRFTSEKEKDVAMRFGVELSLFVAEAMFLLCDDIRSMLLFCGQIMYKYTTGKKDGKNFTQVVKRLIFVMLYVFETYIKPKNGVYKVDGKSTQLELIKMSMSHHFAYGVRNLERIVMVLANGGVMLPANFELYKQEMKKLEEKLRSCKDVSEANGFAREAIKSNILYLWNWKSPSPKIMNAEIRVGDMFRPLLNHAKVDVCSSLIASLQI